MECRKQALNRIEKVKVWKHMCLGVKKNPKSFNYNNVQKEGDLFKSTLCSVSFDNKCPPKWVS